MSKREFLFELDGYGTFEHRYGFDDFAEFCENGARKYVNLPEGLKRVYLVFTKRPRVDSFHIRQNGTLVGVGVYLLHYFREFLKEQYRSGYRYFHFEYDV